MRLPNWTPSALSLSVTRRCKDWLRYGWFTADPAETALENSQLTGGRRATSRLFARPCTRTGIVLYLYSKVPGHGFGAPGLTQFSSGSSFFEYLSIPRELALGYVGLLLFMMGDGVESGYLAHFLQGEGFSQEKIALMFTVYGALAAVAARYSGSLADVCGTSYGDVDGSCGLDRIPSHLFGLLTPEG